MIPKMTFVLLLYSVAREVHRAANSSFDGPPWPMILPFQRAYTLRISHAHEGSRTHTHEKYSSYIVVNVDHALGAGRQATLHQVVIFSKVCGIQVTTNNIVRKILPPHSKPENVHGVLVNKMLHLGCSSTGYGDSVNRTGAIRVATKVETRNIDTTPAGRGRIGRGGGRAGRLGGRGGGHRGGHRNGVGNGRRCVQ